MTAQWIDVRAGERARRHLADRGLSPADVGCLPAAAGGPKGLALLPLDRLLASDWLAQTTRLDLIGASIGAWRMAALAQANPLAALGRLQHAYVRQQNYPERPAAAQVAAVCRGLARAVADGRAMQLRERVALSVLTSRACGALRANTRSAFARAALANALGRERLATHLQRVVFHAGVPSQLDMKQDAFGAECIALTEENQEDALLASGSIPLLCDPVCHIAGAPPGDYWDGGLIDYHLLLPYPQLDRLVLYPHFVPWVTPGWLDKGLPWRARPHLHARLSNVILVAPSSAMLARLPNGRLPDRKDFYRYGLDHAARIAAWEQAIAEMERFAVAAMTWLKSPDVSIVRPL